MTARLRRHRLLVAAAVCAVLAVVLALLASDVAGWRSTVARDDLRFRAIPTHTTLWTPPTLLPRAVSGDLIGTSTTVAWRRALQLFWYSRIGSDPNTGLAGPALRAAAQNGLLEQLANAPTGSQRSQAANLLGVLVVTTPAPPGDQSALGLTLKRGTELFQRAVDLDPGDVDAKENLELALRITKPGKSRIGRDARSGFGFGRGQGSGHKGGGY